MAKTKRRSIFWVVSTHVLTTGFVMPLVAMVVVSAVLLGTQPSPTEAFLGRLAALALGYLGGVYYSLSYIRKVAEIENPQACVKPSIITFAVLAAIGFGLNVTGLLVDQEHGVHPAVGIVGLAVFYIVVGYAFAAVTQRGFSRMEPTVAHA